MFAKVYAGGEARTEERLPAPPARRVNGRVQAGIDAVVVGLTFLIAYAIRQRMRGLAQLDWTLGHKAQLVGMVTGGFVLFGFVLRLYDGTRRSRSQALVLLAATALLTGLSVGSAAFLFHLGYLSRPVAVLYVALAFAGTASWRLAAHARDAAGAWQRKVIVVGSGPAAQEICALVTRSGSELLGVIPEEAAATSPSGARRLGSIEDAEQIFRQQVVDEVIFAVPRARLAEVEQAFTIAEDLGLETKLCLTFLPHRFAKVDYQELGRTPVLSFRSAPAHPVQLGLKRLFDIAVSLLALVAGAPVFLAIAALVKLTSRGPVLFGQARSGLNGRVFTAWKFRSMVQGAEAKLADLRTRNEMSGPVFKMTRDPRVTKLGRFLRKTSLDELPQFWNVLVGEMSIVGPRPPIPDEVAQYSRQQRRRLSVKPGITCIWQVSGRNQVDFDTWMKMDLDYIDNWSLALDLKLFLQTVPAVLLGRGAQ